MNHPVWVAIKWLINIYISAQGLCFEIGNNFFMQIFYTNKLLLEDKEYSEIPNRTDKPFGRKEFQWSDNLPMLLSSNKYKQQT